jgi:hypothetical protein
MENLHKYKLHRKQVGLLWPEGDHQDEKRGHLQDIEKVACLTGERGEVLSALQTNLACRF